MVVQIYCQCVCVGFVFVGDGNYLVVFGVVIKVGGVGYVDEFVGDQWFGYFQWFWYYGVQFGWVGVVCDDEEFVVDEVVWVWWVCGACEWYCECGFVDGFDVYGIFCVGWVVGGVGNWYGVKEWQVIVYCVVFV